MAIAEEVGSNNSTDDLVSTQPELSDGELENVVGGTWNPIEIVTAQKLIQKL